MSIKRPKVDLYEKDGQVLSRFSEEDCDKYDLPAKLWVIDLLKFYGFKAKIDDKKPDGAVDYAACDLVALIQKKIIHIEVEIKESDIWHNVKSGPHIAVRKTKCINNYPQDGFVVQVKGDFTEFLIIRFSDLRKARQGPVYNKQEATNKFCICKKRTRRSRSAKEESFLAVPYSVVHHVVLSDPKDFRSAYVYKRRET